MINLVQFEVCDTIRSHCFPHRSIMLPHLIHSLVRSLVPVFVCAGPKLKKPVIGYQTLRKIRGKDASR